MPDRRIEIATSRTAQWTCVSRAASALESDPHYRSEDHLALLLVPTPLRLLLHLPLARRALSQRISPKGIYEYTIARTKVIDSIYREALAAGLDQILVFGAGFDTRPLRFQAEAGETEVFELDVPVTQQAKLGQYEKRGLSLPPNVRFISIDFDTEVLSEKLAEAGFEKGRKSLFVLEGLLMYLQPESVDGTFRVIEEFAGEDSIVAFDYVRAPVLRGAGSYYGEGEILETVAKAGEQWHFGLEEGDLEGFLAAYGFRVVEHYDAQDLEQMFFTTASGELVGRVNGAHCLVEAVKAEWKAQS